MGGGGKGGGNAAEEARKREEERQQRIRMGMSQIDDTFSAFNDDFFDSRRQAYLDYANPQLEDQWEKAQEELTFALSRAGLLDSSVAAERMADARRQYDRQRQALESAAADYANRARSDVESARSDIVAQLHATADPTAAAQAAVYRAGILSQMPSFSPLGQLFAGIANNIGEMQEAREAQKAVNAISLYNPPHQGSGRVVR